MEYSQTFSLSLGQPSEPTENKMEDFNIEDLIYSDFIDNVLVYRVKQAIYDCRSYIDQLELLDRSFELTDSQREDLDELWTDMESLMVVYKYFSGDYQLEGIKPWE